MTEYRCGLPDVALFLIRFGKAVRTLALIAAVLALAVLAIVWTAPAHAAELPQAEVEKLLEVSTSLRAQGYETEAQAVYDIATGCEFCADDHPPPDEPAAQPWSCEDYEADKAPDHASEPPAGCIHEPRGETK